MTDHAAQARRAYKFGLAASRKSAMSSVCCATMRLSRALTPHLLTQLVDDLLRAELLTGHLQCTFRCSVRVWTLEPDRFFVAVNLTS